MNTGHVTSLRTYLLVWGALLALLALSAGSVWIKLGSFNVILNYTISILKMLLVMVFFMHLKDGNGFIRIVATAGFFWLMLLIALSLSDFLTRYPVPAPW